MKRSGVILMKRLSRDAILLDLFFNPPGTDFPVGMFCLPVFLIEIWR